MKTNLEYYDIYPKVLLTNSETKLTITPLGKHVDFGTENAYSVRIVPMYERKNSYETEYEQVEAVCEGRNLAFTVTIETEQQVSLQVLKNGGELVDTFRVYALEQDLFMLNPYMGDLHVHTCYSDGRESPEFVAAQYRRHGFDFTAMTDHGQYLPSLLAIEAYKEVNSGFNLFPGEEVHIEGCNVHVVNFGGDLSVNAYFQQERPRADREIEAMKTLLPLWEGHGLNENEYYRSQWAFKKIRDNGGLAIFPHPHWQEANAFHIKHTLLEAIFRAGIFDAFELIGGQTLVENQMQVAFYNEMREQGISVPVVGSSDSHGVINAEWFLTGKTVVFAPNCSKNSVIEAVRAKNSVALEREGNAPDACFRIHGSFRLVAYASFLLEDYFPLHDRLCAEQGRLMLEYANGEQQNKELIECYAEKIRGMFGKYWGREE